MTARRRWASVCLFVLAAPIPAGAQVKSCDELRAEIESKISARVDPSEFVLSIVEPEDVDGRKVVGSCEGGTLRIVYQKIEGEWEENYVSITRMSDKRQDMMYESTAEALWRAAMTGGVEWKTLKSFLEASRMEFVNLMARSDDESDEVPFTLVETEHTWGTGMFLIVFDPKGRPIVERDEANRWLNGLFVGVLATSHDGLLDLCVEVRDFPDPTTNTSFWRLEFDGSAYRKRDQRWHGATCGDDVVRRLW